MRVVLASRSPRRRQLLLQLGVAHELCDVAIDETWNGAEPARAHVQRLAVEKAHAGRYTAGPAPMLVIAADTAVVLDDEILGKAESRADARAMLRRLGGRSHHVLTGLAVVVLPSVAAPATVHACVSQTTVALRPLSDEEIDAYVASGEPAGKAGGYAIQGRAAAYIERIDGSYSGVMGLPLFEAATLLRAAGFDWPPDAETDSG